MEPSGAISASSEASRRRAQALIDAGSVAVAVVTFVLFALYAVGIATYPWDWDPGEWGTIDAAQRLVQAPKTLYPRDTVIPIPQTYGPTLALLLVPVLRLCARPYLAARLSMLGIALVIAAAAYLLVRKRSSRPVALLGAALIFAPLNQSFWYVLVRVDAPMIALWLWAAVLALPGQLRRNSETLSWARAVGAGVLLALAVATKATAVAFVVPLIAAWLLVDVRSALRFTASTFASGGGLLLLLQWLTGGGFLATVLLQRILERDASQIPRLLGEALQFNWETLVLFAAGLGWTLKRRDGTWRDGAWALWAVGPLMVPFLAKIGAVFNYLLPGLAAQAILLARWVGRPDAVAPLAGASSVVRTRLPQLALAAVVALVVARHPFPSPDAQDRSTADTFFRFVKTRGKPILAALPQGAYGAVAQPVEADHTDFLAFLRAGLPGTQDVVGRVRTGSYRLLIGNQRDMRFDGAPYREVGFCDLRFYYGLERLVLFVPAGERATEQLAVEPGARCRATTR